MPARDCSPTLEGVYLRNGEEATLVLHATQVGGLNMVKHRLDQRGRDVIRPGNIYVWEEQTQRGLSETCLERWTDGMRWGPSRGGADGFLKYNQKLEEGESGPPLIKRTYSALMRVGGVEAPRKCYIVAYSSTAAEIDARLYNVEALGCLPREVPPRWYQPWRAPRRRGKKPAEAKVKRTSPSTSPVTPSATTSAPRDVHLSLRPPAYPRHAYTTFQQIYEPDRRQYRSTSASSSSEASAASGAPASDVSPMPVYANTAPPIAAPQPVHPGPHAIPLAGDQRRALLPRSGDAAVADEGVGPFMTDQGGATGQNVQQLEDTAQSSFTGAYNGWSAQNRFPAAWSQNAYVMEPYGSYSQSGSQAHSYGLAAMQACNGIPEVPFYPLQAAYRDHLGAPPTYRTTPARFTPYDASDAKYAYAPSSLPNAEYYAWRINTRGQSCSWPYESVDASHPYSYPYTTGEHNGLQSTHYSGQSHFTYTGAASDYAHITTT
ncbi:hypothetical protein K525DRAFT_276082 [Schizophyllum commune Loenen D]|nr:hypothetical protein K525DRAFT_276082 [Schizophyllum commune Loenen D]